MAVSSSLANSSCSHPYTRFKGVTQLGNPEGIKYDAIARFVDDRDGDGVSCGTNGSLTISRSSGFKTVDIIISAGTNYDTTKGNAENDYSFRGDDPAVAVQKSTSSGTQQGYDKLLKAHIEDYQSLFEAFTLSLPDAQKSAGQETSVLISNYSNSGIGDAYLESLLFDYSRYLLIASSRENSLPANLQGKWTEQMNPSWSSDYHANINIQMNYWAADQTGLGKTSVALWNYMKNTWVPRGTETAERLYGVPGWVVHNEMNIFGHTGMKGSAGWANYPVAAAWMMQHVWDNFDYLEYDHIYRRERSGFTSELKSALKKLDKGLHYTSWGGIKEWKLPDSASYDTKNTHRHLSHLVGWYPGYSVSSFQGGYWNETVQAAVEATLKARGNGVQDQDTGWGKAWRAACWARLNNTSQAYSELRLLIDNNFAPNGFDMYQGQKPPFQIDANFGLGGAVLSMLVVDLPNSYVNEDKIRTVVLGPAIPPRWGGGSVKNLRLRGGSAVDFEWDSDGKVTHATLHETGKHVKLVNVLGEELNEE
ncbi:Glyco-hyd-65N-2 domain-containing protein [Fusarium sp. LHS14.1]|nr:Glyco-hyd-65N-2 domain-containing protein [Fusarium sp. LHS14.1]